MFGVFQFLFYFSFLYFGGSELIVAISIYRLISKA